MLSSLLPPEERPIAVRFALYLALSVFGWTALHDIHLIHIEPRHFTEFHQKLLPIENLVLLALQYAFVASFGPGLLFGFLGYAFSRLGRGPKFEPWHVTKGFLLVIFSLECVLLGIGHFAWLHFERTGTVLYPKTWYPELEIGLVYTQTINISAYLLAPAVGFLR
jgi:hypothetical protein